jgi:hypothetical protein
MSKITFSTIIFIFALFSNATSVIYASDFSDVQNRVSKVQSDAPLGTPEIEFYDQK